MITVIIISELWAISSRSVVATEGQWPLDNCK